MVSFDGFVVLLVVALIGVLSVARQVAVLFFPNRSRPAESLTRSFSDFFGWLFFTLPVLVAQAFAALYSRANNNKGLIVFFLVVLAAGIAIYPVENQIQKATDGVNTSTFLPFWNNFVLFFSNLGRVIAEAGILLVSFFGSVIKIAVNEALSITVDCDEMDWTQIPIEIGQFANNTALAPVEFINSTFTGDFNIARPIDNLANAVSAILPIFTCQCSDFSFIYQAFLDPNYGVIQSKHMQQLPDIALNFQIETFLRQPIATGIDVTRRASVFPNYCNLSPPGNQTERECWVSRGPNFDRAADYACTFFTHTMDFLDDDVNAVVRSLEEPTWGIVMPWVSTPRFFSIFAMPVCATFDTAALAMDAVSHVDLFFTISSNVGRGNYAAEVLVERPLSRVYNVTYLIEQIGQDLGGTFPVNFFGFVGTSLRFPIRMIDAFLQGLRGWTARGFSLDYFALTIAGDLSDVTDALEADALLLATYAQNLDALLGHGGKYISVGSSRYIASIVALVREISENSRPAPAVLIYFGTTDFQDRLDDIFAADKIVWGGIGGIVRSWGSFGSVYCYVRDVSVDPDDLSRIELESMDLNIMCTIGTFLEMTGRVYTAFLEYMADAVAATVSIFTTSTSISDFVAPFSPNGAYDPGRPGGIVETQCLLLDTTAMFLPSLFNLGPTRVQCINGDYSDERLYDLTRSIFRMSLTPYFIATSNVRAVSGFMDSAVNGFGVGIWCESIIIPYWKAYVVPNVQLLIASAELVGCFIPDSGPVLNSITMFVGENLIDTNYGGTVVVPCTNFVNNVDGGNVVGWLCDAIEFITNTLQLVFNFIQKGWVAIWELVSGPISAIFEGFEEFFTCILGNITAIFERLYLIGDAFSGFTPNENIGDAFGVVSWVEDVVDAFGNVFSDLQTCKIEISFEEYDPTSPLPDPVSGVIGSSSSPPPSFSLLAGEMVGVCESEGSCYNRPGNTGLLTVQDFTGTECAGTDYNPGPGADILHVGVTCEEWNTTEYQDSIDGVMGACCIPSDQCNSYNYSTCNDLSITLGINTVWVPRENCGSLSGTCRLNSSPKSTQRGCCITEADKDTFDTNLRHAVPQKTGYDCWQLNGPTASTRAYYAPGDRTCSYVQSLGIYNDLLTQNDTTLNGLLDVDPDVQRDCCSPEQYIFRYSVTQRTNVACAIRYTDTPIPPVNRDIYDRPTNVTRIAGTGYDSEIASFLNCRDRDDWMQGNTFDEGDYVWEAALFAPSPVPSIPNWNRYLTLVGNAANWFLPKYDLMPTPTAIQSLSFAAREQLLYRDFDVQCRDYVYVTSTILGSPVKKRYRVLLGAWRDCNAGNCRALTSFGTQLPPLGSFGGVNSDADTWFYFSREVDAATSTPPVSAEDCRFRAKAKPLPVFDRCEDNYDTLDEVTGTNALPGSKSMAILLFTNTTESPVNSPKDLLRDNTDALCNNYVPPDYSTPAPPPPPATTGTTGAFATTGTTGGFGLTTGTTGTTGAAMAPDEYYEAPVYTESFARRSLLEFPTPSYYPNNSIINSSNPCAYIRTLLMSDLETEGTKFLLGKEYALCQFSNMATRVIDILLGGGPNDRYIHPLFFSDGIIHYVTIINATRAVLMAASYNGKYMGEYVKNHTNVTIPENSTLLETWQTNATSWKDYAAQRNVTDPLSVRIGSIWTSATRLFLWFDYNGVSGSIPSMFKAFLGGLRWSLRTESTDYDTYFAMRHLPRYNDSSLPPVISDAGWDSITAFFNFNWYDTSERVANYDNLTLVANSFDNLNLYVQMTSYSAISNRFIANPSTALGRIDGLSAMTMPRRAGVGFGSGSPCNPLDDSCFKCALVKNTLGTIIELVLNTVEDLMDNKRFTLNIHEVDVTYDNTFFLESDARACSGDIEPIGKFDNWIIDGLMDILTNVTGTDVGISIARIRCFLTNTDETDRDSVFLYLNKLVTCDPLTDGSAHRGRGGFGLENALLWVSIGMAAFYLISKLAVPLLPVFWITISVWALLVLFIAYWWSPACGASLVALATGFTWAIPFTGIVLPDRLPSDIYLWIYYLFPKDCTHYPSGVLDDPTCSDLGRTFPNCFADPDLRFDIFGTRHMAFLVTKYLPVLKTIFDNTVFPLFGSISPAFDYSQAFDGMDALVISPRGQYCFGLIPSHGFSVPRAWPLLIGIPQLLLLTSVVTVFAFLALALAYGIYLLGNLLTDLLSNVLIVASKRDRNWRTVFNPATE